MCKEYIGVSARGRKVVEIGVKNMQAWNDEQIPVYDCFEKLKGYKYVAVVDVDEYLIPKKQKNWMELFVSINLTMNLLPKSNY